MIRRSLTILVVFALCITLFRVSVWAHDIPLHTVVTAFVKMQPHEAHLVIRVPLDLLHSAQFPMNGSVYDLGASGPATELSLRGVIQGMVIRENGVRLVPSSWSGHLDLPSDRSFEDYDLASARIAEPVGPGTTIYFDQGYLDALLIYPIDSPNSIFTIQTQITPDLRDLVRLTVRYLPLEGSSARS